MIFVRSAHEAHISVVSHGTGGFKVQGMVGDQTVNFNCTNAKATKTMLEMLGNEHRQFTGEALCVFDMTERVYR